MVYGVMEREAIFVCIFLFLNLPETETATASSLSSESRLDELENQMEYAFQSINTHKDEIINIESELGVQENRILNLKNSLKSKRQSAIVVGFTALVNKPLANLTVNQVIKFDHAITNVGGAYVPQTGQFICPLNGLYQFAASIVSKGSGKNVEIEIVREGKLLVKIHATGYAHDTGSQIVIIHCIEGQKVWVKHHAGTNSKATVAANSYFSGHLIYTD